MKTELFHENSVSLSLEYTTSEALSNYVELGPVHMNPGQ